jgi:hypothetical protein
LLVGGGLSLLLAARVERGVVGDGWKVRGLALLAAGEEVEDG